MTKYEAFGPEAIQVIRDTKLPDGWESIDNPVVRSGWKLLAAFKNYFSDEAQS